VPAIREYKVRENIVIFDSHMDPSRSGYDARLLKDQEDKESKHFWFRTRRDKICSFFQRNVEKKARILEIGGGTGFVAEKLKS